MLEPEYEKPVARYVAFQADVPVTTISGGDMPDPSQSEDDD